mgnify:CR=1 FL=1
MEFLVDVSTGEHYFLEVNTRLQVEHTVTEEVYGVDLVALQLRTACGASLEQLKHLLPPVAFKPSRHALQMRLCMEDPDKDCVPSCGSLRLVTWPKPSNRTRLEIGIEAGCSVSPYYDSMVAKVKERTGKFRS